jgi:acyl-CoA dehydrogenase
VDFETDPEYPAKLDWVEEFMVDELEPLDLVALDPSDRKNAETMAILRPLQRLVPTAFTKPCLDLYSARRPPHRP